MFYLSCDVLLWIWFSFVIVEYYNFCVRGLFVEVCSFRLIVLFGFVC